MQGPEVLWKVLSVAMQLYAVHWQCNTVVVGAFVVVILVIRAFVFYIFHLSALQVQG